VSRARLGREETLALAHELRTPLTSLALAVGLLRAERGAGHQRELVDGMAEDVERLQALVDRTLHVDRLGSYAGPLVRTDVDLADVVARALPPLRRQAAGHQVRVAEHLEPHAVVRADAAKLGWIAASLVGNALRFTPPGGAVRVRVFARGARAFVRVADAGPGIAAERRRAVLGREAGGTLFLVREIVSAHGGALRLWSRVGRGATFTVVLPIAPSHEPS
jgi:signal transduction histidine kinase